MGDPFGRDGADYGPGKLSFLENHWIISTSKKNQLGFEEIGRLLVAGAGVLVCCCAGVPVCMCASVLVIAVVYQYTGVQHFCWFCYNFPSIVLCVCYNSPMIFFSSSMLFFGFLLVFVCFSNWCSYEFPMVFLWLPLVFLGFLCFPFSFPGCPFGFPMNFLLVSYDSLWFS